MSSGQCRLAPLIQVIQDCSHLYHYTVKLMFKLHSCECLLTGSATVGLGVPAAGSHAEPGPAVWVCWEQLAHETNCRFPSLEPRVS